MKLHAKNPFMIPSFTFTSFYSNAKENDANQPYQLTQHWLQGYQASQQHLLQGWWDYLTWQQWSLQRSFFDGIRWYTHCLQLTQQPQTLYRYTRMNWQKPYLGLNAQAVTANRLLTGVWTDSLQAWQQIHAKPATATASKPASAPTPPNQALIKQPAHKRKH